MSINTYAEVFVIGRWKKLIAKRNRNHDSGSAELFKIINKLFVAEVRIGKKNFYHALIYRIWKPSFSSAFSSTYTSRTL